MGPSRLDFETMTQQVDLAVIIGPADINNGSTVEGRSFIPAPLIRKACAGRGSLGAAGRSSTMCLNVARRASLQIGNRVVMESLPDFSLPVTVEALNGRLKAGFLRRSKHWSHLQTQTQPNHSTDGIGKLMVALEKRVIVELSKAGQAQRTPMFHQHLQYGRRIDYVSGPRSDQTSVQGNAIENSNFNATFNDQPFDHVEAIKLALARSQLRQIPAQRRWTAPRPSFPIQGASSFQDAADGANRRRFSQSPGQPLTSARHGAKVSPDTGMAALVTHTHKPIHF